MPELRYSHRPVAYGAHDVVAAARPFATLAGIEVLTVERGADPRGDGLALAY